MGTTVGTTAQPVEVCFLIVYPQDFHQGLTNPQYRGCTNSIQEGAQTSWTPPRLSSPHVETTHYIYS
jgi:hypothetical protein